MNTMQAPKGSVRYVVGICMNSGYFMMSPMSQIDMNTKPTEPARRRKLPWAHAVMTSTFVHKCVINSTKCSPYMN